MVPVSTDMFQHFCWYRSAGCVLSEE